jgi:hypothetical protein
VAAQVWSHYAISAGGKLLRNDTPSGAMIKNSVHY